MSEPFQNIIVKTSNGEECSYCGRFLPANSSARFVEKRGIYLCPLHEQTSCISNPAQPETYGNFVIDPEQSTSSFRITFDRDVVL